jgi:hypothetical protein
VCEKLEKGGGGQTGLAQSGGEVTEKKKKNF